MTLLGAFLNRAFELPPQRKQLNALPPLYPLMAWGPAIDGTKQGLLDLPLTLLRQGAFAKVPIIFGTNRDEGMIFAPELPQIVPGTHFPPTTDDIEKGVEHLLDMFKTNLTKVIAAEVVAMYPSSAFQDEWHRMSAILTDFMFACSVRRAARVIADFGVPIWLYHYEYAMDFIEYPLLGGTSGWWVGPSAHAACVVSIPCLVVFACVPCRVRRLPHFGALLRLG